MVLGIRSVDGSAGIGDQIARGVVVGPGDVQRVAAAHHFDRQGTGHRVSCLEGGGFRQAFGARELQLDGAGFVRKGESSGESLRRGDGLGAAVGADRARAAGQEQPKGDDCERGPETDLRDHD
jgi:hypothetical protein